MSGYVNKCSGFARATGLVIVCATAFCERRLMIGINARRMNRGWMEPLPTIDRNVSGRKLQIE